MKNEITLHEKKETLSSALDKNNLNNDIGEKVIDYGNGIADVISKPIEALGKISDEKAVFEDAIFDLFVLWKDKKYEEMSDIFSYFGYDITQKIIGSSDD